MNDLLSPISYEVLKTLRRQELLIFAQGEQDLRLQLQDNVNELQKVICELKGEQASVAEKLLSMSEQLVNLKHRLFAGSSERGGGEPEGDKDLRSPEALNPSDLQPEPSPEPCPPPPCGSPKAKRGSLRERYPNLPVVVEHLTQDDPGSCRHCQHPLADAGLDEVSEQLTVIPRRYLIKQIRRHQYHCHHCHQGLLTTPCPPRMMPGSIYSDELILDVVLSKYCDLIPLDRYVAMAARQGVANLPLSSLLALSHYFADYVLVAVQLVKLEVQSARVMHGDETRHRMLEGDENPNWYLWGFACQIAHYFECHPSRSGDIAHDFLSECLCEVFVSDVYSGYHKALRLANEERRTSPPIIAAFCNAHARRKFKEALQNDFSQAKFFLQTYRAIYDWERQACELNEEEKPNFRQLHQQPLFEAMLQKAESLLESYSKHSSFAMAMQYFINHYQGLTHYLIDGGVPLDNNMLERALRNPVIGRKTWYGTHSRKGAETAARLFTLVESCKLVKVNPRSYFQALIQRLHAGQEALTPWQYKQTLTTG